MTTKHTPTPWRQSRQGHDILHDGKGEKVLIGICTEKDNVAFIVRAVNIHDDLIEALESVQRILDYTSYFNEEDKQRVNAALAKAKGE